MKLWQKHTALRRKQRHKRQMRLGYVFVILCLLLEGLYSPLAKSLSAHLSAMALLQLTEALTAAFVIIVLGFFPLLKALATMRRKTMGMAALIGVLNSGIAPFLLLQGVRMTTATNASLLGSTSTIFALILGFLLLRETVRREQIVGGLIVMLGVVIMQFAAAPLALGMHTGDMLVILAGVVFSFGTVFFKRYLTHENPEVVLFVRAVSGTIVMAALSFLLHQDVLGEMYQLPMAVIPVLLAFAFFGRFLDLTFLYGALDRLPSSTVNLVLNATPLTGVFFSVILLGEQLTQAHVIAGLCIIVGLMLGEMHVRVHLSKVGGRLLGRQASVSV